MTAYSHSVEIARPPEEVFAFVSDPLALLRWQPSLVSLEPHAPGPLHQPCTRTAIECTDGPVPFRGTFELEPAEGGTRFTWTGRLRQLLEGACPER